MIQRRKIIIKEGIRKTKRREEISGRRVRRRRRRLRRRGRKKGRKRRKVRKVEREKENSNFSRKEPEVNWRKRSLIRTTIEDMSNCFIRRITTRAGRRR